VSPGLYGPRPGSGEEVDPERTPVYRHEKPSPVVVRSGTMPRLPPPLPPQAAPRVPTAPGGTLAALGPRPPSAPPVAVAAFTTEERPTQRGQRLAIMSKILRTCDALPVEDLQLLLSMGLRLRPGVGE
jgi:hypothetical protein